MRLILFKRQKACQLHICMVGLGQSINLYALLYFHNFSIFCLGIALHASDHVTKSNSKTRVTDMAALE